MDIKVETKNESVKTESNVNNIKKIEIPACLLILFAEYLGYCSPFFDWCEEWCSKDSFPDFKKNILFIDAYLTLKKMVKEYDFETLHDYYDKFYDAAIKNWETKLKEHDASALNFVVYE